jgi:hypothetical protein
MDFKDCVWAESRGRVFVPNDAPREKLDETFYAWCTSEDGWGTEAECQCWVSETSNTVKDSQLREFLYQVGAIGFEPRLSDTNASAFAESGDKCGVL